MIIVVMVVAVMMYMGMIVMMMMVVVVVAVVALERWLQSFPIPNPLLQSELTFTILDNLLKPFSGK